MILLLFNLRARYKRWRYARSRRRWAWLQGRPYPKQRPHGHVS